MKFETHIVVSTCVSGALYAVFRSWELALSAWIAGVLVDLDHVPDYLIQFGPRLDIPRFFNSFPEGEYNRIFILLHAWEWLPIMLAVSWVTGWNPWLLGWLVGHSQHMILDQVGNRAGMFTYFLLFRARNRFVSRKCFREYPRNGIEDR
ncbi:MAG: hypothetical protein E4H02_10640 [Lentisphaerales bacterium]|jgi:hypothetical protein|nr:MAG: hypothetical protein E4H02_10640 [Lentisphaerales bacterium]